MGQVAELSKFRARRDDAQAPAPPSKGPQVEDGYTRIANELLEQIMAAPLTLREMRVVMAVVRLTFGWNRKQARVTGGLLSKLTGLPESIGAKVFAGLIAKGVILRHGGSRSPVSLNKRVEEWEVTAPKHTTPPPYSKCTDSEQNALSDSEQNALPSKDRKDTLEPKGSKSSSKKPSPKKWGEEIDHELAEFMHATVTADLTNPKKTNLTAWANDIRLMRTRDGRTVEQIRYLIKWVSRDSFWKANVLCPAKLREKWDQLELKVIAYKESRHANRSGTDEKRANQDRIAAMLSNPNDTSWIEGLFPDEESGDLGASEPSVHEAGGDLSQDVEKRVFDAGHGEAGEA
ncbi:replication protein [Halomonas sp. ISL-60]|uniref:replication protein n=1 Tax=Halomonas sp. ISL-56 TaxID=2819149 RepID=UPI001BE65BD8|nr:replication protein [Halomonas sp. ISL-56]MBT2772946.1 replication protein [Halomonas sp. ISL-60]MBT2799993.1 replication protein [Halomonas sp. ISL-56]